MIDLLLGQEGQLTYIALMLALLGGAIGLPIPEDIPLIVAGVLVHRKAATLLGVFSSCYVAILAGDLIIFFIGKRYGPALFNTDWFKKRVPNTKIKRVRISLERRSLLMIFIARHLFYLRTVTFLTCGAVKMRLRSFLFADALAALVSLPIMVGLGYFASEHFDSARKSYRRVELLMLIGFILLLACIYLYRWMVKGQDQAEE